MFFTDARTDSPPPVRAEADGRVFVVHSLAEGSRRADHRDLSPRWRVFTPEKDAPPGALAVQRAGLPLPQASKLVQSINKKLRRR